MNSTGLQLYNELMLSWKPPPKLTVSEWADEYRYLSSESASEPGKWHTSRAEYQRGIMDAISDPEVESVVWMSSSQVGKTEILNNVVGYYIDQEPAPILVVQPTLHPMADEWSKDRLAPMIRDTPVLKAKVSDVKTRDSSNTIYHKNFPGGTLNVCGANSPASLSAKPRRVVLCDEVSRYNPSAGTEGDPVDLAIKRTENFWNRKIVLISTPGTKGRCRIEREFNETDKRKYFIPCPECGEFQELKWANVSWMKDDAGNHLPKTAVFICDFCQHPIDDFERWEAVSKGEWRSTVKAVNPKKVGFHIWAAYSPWTAMQKIVEEFLAKKKDKENFKTFVNTTWGESYEEKLTQIGIEGLYSIRENYKKQCPEGVLVLTCSVDVQKNRVEGEIKGWGIGQECWGIEYFIIYGETDDFDNPVWADLAKKLTTVYEHESGIRLRISMTTIDSGYMSDVVYKFCKKYVRRRVYATKGKGDSGRPIVSRISKTKKSGVALFTIGTDAAKERVYSRLQMTLKHYQELQKDENKSITDGPQPGIMHFPFEYDFEYFEQLTAEKVRPKMIRGFETREWFKAPGQANEALDITVGNFAALAILAPNFKKIKADLQHKIGASQSKTEVSRQRKKPSGPRQNSWVNSWK